MQAESETKNESIFNRVERGIKKYKESIYVFLAIIGIIATMIAAFLGAAYGAEKAYGYDLQKSEIQEKNIAQALYIDIKSLDSTLKVADEQLKNSNEKDRSYGYHIFYPENGIYYSYQTEISSLDYPIAKNITRFYSSLTMAERERQEIAVLMDDLSHTPENNPNNTGRVNLLQNIKLDTVNFLSGQMRSELREAIELQPIIKKQLEEKYKISSSV